MRKNLERIEVHIPIKESGKQRRATFNPSKTHLIESCGIINSDLGFFAAGIPKIHLWRDTADYVLVSDIGDYSLENGIIGDKLVPKRFLVYERRENSEYKKRIDRGIRSSNNGGKGLV